MWEKIQKKWKKLCSIKGGTRFSYKLQVKLKGPKQSPKKGENSTPCQINANILQTLSLLSSLS